MRYTIFYADVSPADYDPTHIYQYKRHDLLASDANAAAAQFKELHPNKRIYTIYPTNDILDLKRHNCYDMGNIFECRQCGRSLNRPRSWFEMMEQIGWLEGVTSDDEF